MGKNEEVPILISEIIGFKVLTFHVYTFPNKRELFIASNMSSFVLKRTKECNVILTVWFFLIETLELILDLDIPQVLLGLFFIRQIVAACHEYIYRYLING